MPSRKLDEDLALLRKLAAAYEAACQRVIAQRRQVLSSLRQLLKVPDGQPTR